MAFTLAANPEPHLLLGNPAWPQLPVSCPVAKPRCGFGGQWLHQTLITPLKMESNFPELLAHDLDASNSVFAAKRMTAGAPSVFSMNAVQNLMPVKEADLHLVDQSVSVRLDDEGYTPAPSPEVRYYPLGRQTTPLEPIDEGPVDGTTHDGDTIACHAESDWDSLSSSSHQSSTMEPPFAGPRDASVVTTATSTASGPLPTGLANNGGVAKSLPNVSWIDADSDDEESPSPDSSFAPSIPHLRRPLQFTIEPETILSYGTDMCPDVDDGARGAQTPVSVRSLTKEDNYTLHSERVTKRWPSRRRGIIRFATDQIFPPGFPTSPLGDKISSIPTPETPEMPSFSSPTFAPRQPEVMSETQDEVFESKGFSPLSTSTRGGSCPVDRPDSERQPARSIDNHQELLSPGPVKQSNVQTWVESSRVVATKLDDQLPWIPLPPDVVDNLRISITCFPDTMLLTSSLSIETIRSYSRKVKASLSGLKHDLSQPLSSSPKKWSFSRFISRRSNASSHDRGSRDSTEASASPWTPLRAVFPSGSEYLCDALYAHIVAYNYISSVQRCVPSSPSKPSRKAADDGEVPQKAAALLGLRDADASSVGTARSLTGTSCHGSSDKNEGALRDLLVGLSRCMARLIATLQEGSCEVAGEGSSDVDLFFVRALCEVVRCSEER